jgi:hypothetical protein
MTKLKIKFRDFQCKNVNMNEFDFKIADNLQFAQMQESFKTSKKESRKDTFTPFICQVTTKSNTQFKNIQNV